MSRLYKFWISAALAVLVLALPVHAQNVLTIRVESLDAVIDDVDKIAVALGQEPGSGDGLVRMVAGQLGLQDLDIIDGKNPLVVALPLQGVMLGEQGFVGAFPVADMDAAVAAMKAAKEGVTVDENGLVHVPMGEAAEMLLMPSDGYMIYGRNPNLVGGFDPAGLLSGAHLPPGTLAAEFNVDSMRAMIGMSLEGARQGITQAITQGAEKGGEAMDPEAAAALSGTVVSWMQALIANTRSIQLSLEVTDSHVMMHNHYLPVADSTLGGFLQAQKGGMPDIARFLDGKDASMAMVANVTWTDELIGGLESFMKGYSGMLQHMLKGEQQMAGFAEMMPAMMEQYSGMMKCMRGDMAQVVDMSDGMSFVQVSGIKDTDECRSMDKTVGEIFAAMPEEFAEMMTYSSGALSHGGVQVAKTSFRMDQFMAVPGEAGEQATAMMKGMFGEEGLTTYMGASNDLWLGTGGAGGDKAMRTLIDRVQKAKHGAGIDAGAFAPFDVNAGFYMSMDFGKFFAGMQGLIPDEDTGELAEVQQVMDALGVMTGAMELQKDALALKFAMGTDGLSTVAQMIQEKQAAEYEAAEQQHEEGHGHGHGEHDEGHD